MRRKEREIEFNVNANTARLIGRENVSKLEGAVLEIVKNAYDADAKVFCLYYSENDQCIYILDNGCGMTEEVIINHWMTIGRSSKKDTYVTPGNRVQTGAKGIGRFALDRLSDECNMLTVSTQGGLEWIVNWNDFNDSKRISDVKAKIYDTDSGLLEYVHIDEWHNSDLANYIKTLGFENTGTAFCLKGLHDDWDEVTRLRLRNHLENLLPPNVSADFEIWFFDDQTDLENAKINSANVDSYDYRIDFKVTGDQLKIQILRNEFDFRGDDQTIFDEAGFDDEEQAYFNGLKKVKLMSIKMICGRENCIGDFSGVLYFYKITQSQKDRKKFFAKDISGRPNLVKQFGGIKLYRDGFRVRPYGEYGSSDFDWLELSARKNRSPAGMGNVNGNWRVNAEQLLGNVSISRENTNLDDDANRGGIQEGVGIAQLKKILLAVIDEFERDRQSVGRKLAAYANQKDELQKKIDDMQNLANERKKWEEERERLEKKCDVNRGDIKDIPTADPRDVVTLLDEIQQQNEQDYQDLKDENKMLQTLATTGIVTNMFMHEIRTLTNNIGQELDSAYEAIKYDEDSEYALTNILHAITEKKNFQAWFRITIDSVKKDKRTRRKQNLLEMLSPFMETWDDILRRSNITLQYNCENNLDLICFEFDIENIISNLITNSMASFDRAMEMVLDKKVISLKISGLGDGILIDYKDSGWGLIPRYKEEPELILEPFESGKTLNNMSGEDDGTGMGMWIVNNTILEYNGYIDLSENRRSEMGFFVKILLKGRGN